jgi:ankyrin repeat protein
MIAFLYAAEAGHLSVVQYLLSSEVGASITEADDDGSTALLLAAGGRNYRISSIDQ